MKKLAASVPFGSAITEEELAAAASRGRQAGGNNPALLPPHQPRLVAPALSTELSYVQSDPGQSCWQYPHGTKSHVAHLPVVGPSVGTGTREESVKMLGSALTEEELGAAVCRPPENVPLRSGVLNVIMIAQIPAIAKTSEPAFELRRMNIFDS